MDSRPNDNMVLANGCDPLLNTTATATSATSSSSQPSSSNMPPPTATTPIPPPPPPQLDRCVYVINPWRRSQTIFTASQPTSQNNSALFRFHHPPGAPMGLLRFAPYRQYYPIPSRTSGSAVPQNYTQDYRYAHEFYNSGYPGGAPDFGSFTGSDHVQPPDDTATAQSNYDPIYPNPYPPPPTYTAYNQQQCWPHPPVACDPAEATNKTLAFYPEPLKVQSNDCVSGDGPSRAGSSEAGNVTKKSVRVKFMGPETIYLTTKTLEMQPRRNPLDSGSQNLTVIGTPPEGSIHIYENLRGAEPTNDFSEVVIQSSDDLNVDEDQERVTFGSIEEALASIDPSSLDTDTVLPPTPAIVDDKTYLQATAVSYQGLKMADDKQEEVIKAAKSLFSKRTRTLYHWLYPETSKNKLKATVSAAWDTLAEMEKQFYVSQVLGRFGLQASSLMINPQLDGIKGLPTEVSCPPGTSADPRNRIPHLSPTEPGKLASAIEAQQAVDQLFASCADSDSWTSYCGMSPASASTSALIHPSTPSLPAAPLILPATSTMSVSHSCTRSIKSQGTCCGSGHGQSDSKRKRTFSRMSETGGRARLGAVNDQLDEEVTILKRMREAKLQAEFDEDPELTSEFEKFRGLITQDNDRNSTCRDGDDFWRRTPDPEDLFTHLEF